MKNDASFQGEGDDIMTAFTVDYDRIAATYAARRNASQRVVAHICRHMGGSPSGIILEIGCGTADHLFVLSRILRAEGYGFDLSHGMLEEAGRKNPGLHLTWGDASKTFPYPEDRFDLAFSVNVIHYISDLPAFFSEAFRTVRPGGTVVTVTDSREDILRRTMSHYFPESVDIELKRYPPIEAIEKAMTQAGFVGLEVTHTEHKSEMTPAHVEQYRSKAFSGVRLVSQACFEEGMRRVESDMAAGTAMVTELYTYVWGRKP